MRQARKVTPETLVKREIRQCLSMYGWDFFPILQGMGSQPGVPDLIAFKSGRVLFIEAKTAKGAQSPAQVAMQARLEAQGCAYVIIKSFEDMQAVLCDKP